MFEEIFQRIPYDFCSSFQTCTETSCGVRDARMNLMVRQICQKSEVIAENLSDVKSKLDGLENAYHDMMMRVQRLQSNRVCLGLLTGCDYPGERHPDNCPCANQRVKEEKVQESNGVSERGHLGSYFNLLLIVK